mmetsp:Transcript_3093/g.7281  ORF Transcript_3093/g.7281 Transcript_3093/m.7281 type:complete len:798 (+) Transcript_3093:596-2989(+)
MGVAHRAARVGLLVERGEHLHALEGIGVDRVVEELVVHAQLVGEAAERGGLVPRTRHATVQHHAARLRRRVVDEVRAEDLLDHARGVAERGGAARILPVEEGGEARVQPEHGEPLLEVARERLARGVEDLPRVVDEDDQVVPRRRGQLELRRVVRDDGAPPLLGEQRADVRRGGGGAAVHVVEHRRVHERRLPPHLRLGRGAKQRAGAVCGDGRLADGQRAHERVGDLVHVQRAAEGRLVELDQLGHVGAARRDGDAAPPREVVRLGGEHRVRLPAVRDVEGGELREAAAEAAADHLLLLVARRLGDGGAVVHCRLELDVVRHAEAREAEVHQDGVHRLVDDLRAAAGAADRGEGAADAPVELRPVARLREVVPELLHPPRDAAQVGGAPAGDAVRPVDVGERGGHVVLPHLLAVPVVVRARDGAQAHLHVVELHRALDDELGHLPRAGGGGVVEHEDLGGARRPRDFERVARHVKLDGLRDRVHLRHEPREVRARRVRVEVALRLPPLHDAEGVLGAGADEVVVLAPLLLPCRRRHLVGEVQPLLLLLLGNLLHNREEHLLPIHLHGGRRGGQRRHRAAVGDRRRLRRELGHLLPFEQVDLGPPADGAEPFLQVVDRVPLVPRDGVVRHVDALRHVGAVPRGHQLGHARARERFGGDARHPPHAGLVVRADGGDEAVDQIGERDRAQRRLGEVLRLLERVRLLEALGRLHLPRDLLPVHYAVEVADVRGVGHRRADAHDDELHVLVLLLRRHQVEELLDGVLGVGVGPRPALVRVVRRHRKLTRRVGRRASADTRD